MLPAAHCGFGDDNQGGAVACGAGLKFAQCQAGKRNGLLVGGGGIVGGNLIIQCLVAGQRGVCWLPAVQQAGRIIMLAVEFQVLAALQHDVR